MRPVHKPEHLMIKIFNKIRQKLLNEGHIGQYLKYAIGEIILVVIGILIALSINNWNESRKQAKAESEFKEGVKNDLGRDKEYILMIMEMAEKKEVAFTVLNEHMKALYENDRNRLDSILQEYFVTQRTFYPISGSFQAAVSGNEISKFRDKEFSTAVTRLYQSTYARLMDNAQDTDNRWQYFTRKYSGIRRKGRMPDMTGEALEEFLDDMYFHRFALKYYRNNLETTLSEIDELISPL